VAWWVWLLVGWVTLSIAGAFFLGAMAATVREREPRRVAEHPDG
jgi:hypothetical protein